MFRLAGNKEIGAYLRKLINEKDISIRRFGTMMLERRGEPTDPAAVQRIANRLSQILSGSKSLQLADLPDISGILGISCEELLSAGETRVAIDRLTNYVVGYSKDKDIWQRYIDQEDKSILNADEYCMTVLEYAMKAKNYDFIRYLVDKGYIWFVDDDTNINQWGSFGAGTSIKIGEGQRFRNYNVWASLMGESSILRKETIRMALEHGDLDMLERMHAREIPYMGFLNVFTSYRMNSEKYYDEQQVMLVAGSGDAVLEYFSDEFIIESGRPGGDHKVVYPYISQLASELICSGHPFARRLLEKTIEHNRAARERLRVLMKRAYEEILLEYDEAMRKGSRYLPEEKRISDEILAYFYREKDGYVIAFCDGWAEKGKREGITTNLVLIEEASADDDIQALIDENNRIFSDIWNMSRVTRENGGEEV